MYSDVSGTAATVGGCGAYTIDVGNCTYWPPQNPVSIPPQPVSYPVYAPVYLVPPMPQFYPNSEIGDLIKVLNRLAEAMEKKNVRRRGK